jgi:hypothetical protein
MLAIDYRTLINRDLPAVERGCTSKSPFTSRREATHVARHGRHASGQLEAYHCRWCDLWHLGPGRRNRDRR